MSLKLQIYDELKILDPGLTQTMNDLIVGPKNLKNVHLTKYKEMATSFMHIIYRVLLYFSVVACLSRPTGGDSFYVYWMFFGRELLQPVEIKIQTGETELILLFMKHCFVKDSKATISIIN